MTPTEIIAHELLFSVRYGVERKAENVVARLEREGYEIRRKVSRDELAQRLFTDRRFARQYDAEVWHTNGDSIPTIVASNDWPPPAPGTGRWYLKALIGFSHDTKERS